MPKKSKKPLELTQPAKPPAEGECFLIFPERINQTLFQQPREDKKQEKMRLRILEAFAKVNEKSYGTRYKVPSETMIPKKTWTRATFEELTQVKKLLGFSGFNWANITHQALEWAQRIHNGESWEVLCNEKDPVPYHRFVRVCNWDGKLIGGSSKSILADFDRFAPSYVHDNYQCDSDNFVYDVVPLVYRLRFDLYRQMNTHR